MQGGGLQPEEAGGGDPPAPGGDCQGVDERRHVLVRVGHGLSAQRGAGNTISMRISALYSMGFNQRYYKTISYSIFGLNQVSFLFRYYFVVFG